MNKIVTFFRESSLARFLIPVGITFIIFGVIVLIINIKNQDYIEVTSTVSKVELAEAAHTDVDGNYIEATYDVTVKYTVDGNDYETVLGGLSKYNVGDKMPIYYNPEDPSKITQTKSLILPIGLIVVGFISLVIGIISGIKAIKKIE